MKFIRVTSCIIYAGNESLNAPMLPGPQYVTSPSLSPSLSISCVRVDPEYSGPGLLAPSRYSSQPEQIINILLVHYLSDWLSYRHE